MTSTSAFILLPHTPRSSASIFTVSCSGVTNVDTIEMEVVLQKKGLLGIYTKEDEASKTVSKNVDILLLVVTKPIIKNTPSFKDIL